MNGKAVLNGLFAVGSWLLCWFLPVWLACIGLCFAGLYFADGVDFAIFMQLFPVVGLLSAVAALYIAGSASST